MEVQRVGETRMWSEGRYSTFPVLLPLVLRETWGSTQPVSISYLHVDRVFWTVDLVLLIHPRSPIPVGPPVHTGDGKRSVSSLIDSSVTDGTSGPGTTSTLWFSCTDGDRPRSLRRRFSQSVYS